MGLNFPDAPTVGQVFPPYVWDGEKWDYSGSPGMPGTANVKMSDTPPVDAIPGDLWLETDTGFVFVLVDDGTSLQWAVTNPIVPITGAQGIQGIQGIPGNTILYGTSDPDDGQGVDGNFYINTATHFMFGPKVAGAWPAGASLVGPQGIQGIQGIQGPVGDMTVATDDVAPATAGDRTLWWSGADGVLYIRYRDVDSVAWVQAAPSTVDLSTRVRHDAPQGLTIGQQTQARQNIFAAPLDALAYSGMQVNGGMEIAQELGTAQASASGSYICDNWLMTFTGTVTMLAAQATGTFPGFSNFIYMTNTNAPALGASDYALLINAIEGYRVRRVAWGTASAQPITIGFWSANTPAGIYTGVVRNADATRSYAFQYTQAVANTPQFNTVTIPGDTAGTWLANNGVGLQLIFALACGSGVIAPSLNTWLAGNYVAGPGQLNGIAAANNAIRITGVVVLPGIEAPSAVRSPFIMRPYDQELVTLQRLYQKVSAGGGGITNGSAGVYGWSFPLPTVMRAAPAASITPGIAWTTATQAFTTGAVTVNNCTPSAWHVNTDASIAITGNLPAVVYPNAGGFCILNARLF
jgi:hypothetical protein